MASPTVDGSLCGEYRHPAGSLPPLPLSMRRIIAYRVSLLACPCFEHGQELVVRQLLAAGHAGNRATAGYHQPGRWDA